METEQTKERIIDIKQTKIPSEETNYININTEHQTERDVLSSDFPTFDDGVFYGAYFPSSLFELGYTGSTIILNSTFIFNSNVIMNGVSEWWLRIPINPNSIKLNYNYSTFPDTKYYFKYYSDCSPKIYINNYPISYSLNYETIKIGDDGIYIKPLFILLPGTSYTIKIELLLKENIKPQIYLTQEKITTTGTSKIIIGSLTKDLRIDLSFGFCFLRGIGHNGFFSYKFEFSNKIDFTFSTYNIIKKSDYTTSDYYSLYLPFNTNTNKAHIKMTTRAIVGASDPAFWDSVSNVPSYTGLDTDININNDFILISSKQNLSKYGSDNYISITTTITFYNITEITLLTKIPEEIKNLGSYYYKDKFSDDLVASNYNFISFNDVTSGRYVYITPEEYYTIFDFGFTKKYVTGTININSILFNDVGGNYLIEYDGDPRDFSIKLWENVTNIPSNIWGFMESTFNSIISALNSLGQFIYDGLLWLYDVLVNLVLATLEVLGSIANYLLFCIMPLTAILAVWGTGKLVYYKEELD